MKLNIILFATSLVLLSCKKETELKEQFVEAKTYSNLEKANWFLG